MSAGFEQGAVYAPRYSWEGRSVPSPDEDTFTMAVSALEALGARPTSPTPSRILLVGEFPPVVDWALPAYLDQPLDLARHSGDAAGLAAAVRDAAEGSGESGCLVIAFDRTGPQGAHSVAMRFGSHVASRAPDWTARTGFEGAASLARAALAQIGVGTETDSGGPAPPSAWLADGVAAFTSIGLAQVSEGAYVPRPRYLENLPSRWRLEADRCAHCQRVTFPRRRACRYCGRSDRLSPLALPRDGARVVAATVIGKGGQPTEFDPQVDALGAYGVVLAEFEPGVRLTLQVTDASPGEVQIGDRVGTRLRRLYPMEGEWRYGRKAVPLPA
jgi:uncharacterized OB-fold protein